MSYLLARLDGAVGLLVSALAWLALPVALILFLQWPLREVVHGYSRQANDLGQLLFAVYIAVALTAATRSGRHLAADTLARHYSPRVRRILAVVGTVLGPLPWAAFAVYQGWPAMAASVGALERFPDTFNPGYFAIKIAGCALAALVFAQAIVDIARAFTTSPHP